VCVRIKKRVIRRSQMPRSKPNRHVMKKEQKTKPKAKRTTKLRAGGVGDFVGDVASVFAGPVGGRAARAATNFLAKVTGHGDYNLSGNSFLAGSPPSFLNSTKGMRVTHREYVQDIYGAASGTFTIATGLSQAPINPGLSSLFPWLSQIAANFENYRFLGLIFEYKSTSSNYVSSTGALGTALLATQYDVHSPAFTTKQQMDGYEFATSGRADATLIHPVECARGSDTLDTLLIRVGTSTSPVPTGADQSFYDIGELTVAAQGQNSGTAYAIGELWVSYDVLLTKPHISNSVSSTGLTTLDMSHWQGVMGGPGLLASTSGVYVDDDYLFYSSGTGAHVLPTWTTQTGGAIPYRLANTGGVGGCLMVILPLGKFIYVSSVSI